jgi:hypothetical protein
MLRPHCIPGLCFFIPQGSILFSHCYEKIESRQYLSRKLPKRVNNKRQLESKINDLAVVHLHHRGGSAIFPPSSIHPLLPRAVILSQSSNDRSARPRYLCLKQSILVNRQIYSFIASIIIMGCTTSSTKQTSLDPVPPPGKKVESVTSPTTVKHQVNKKQKKRGEESGESIELGAGTVSPRTKSLANMKTKKAAPNAWKPTNATTIISAKKPTTVTSVNSTPKRKLGPVVVRNQDRFLQGPGQRKPVGRPLKKVALKPLGPGKPNLIKKAINVPRAVQSVPGSVDVQ